MKPVKKRVRVKNTLGLHTRPATAIVKLLQKYQAKVEFTYKKTTVNARSIMGILMLAAKKSSWITITATGVDAQLVVEHLYAEFDTKFGEET